LNVGDERIFRTCAWRLIPLMLVLYFVNYLDRVNVAFASLTMVRDLNLSPSEYGFGAGILFVGYFAFHVPANLILERMGARRWMFLILLVWGALSAGTALVQGPYSFFILRFILGAAEAGLFPGLIFYLTLWFPPEYRARYAANFLIGLPLAFVIGSPLSGLLLELDGLGGLHGWQWMFILEGLPACALALIVLRWLPDGPAHASWLSPAEKQYIATRLTAKAPTEHHSLWKALSDKRVIVLGLIFFADQSAASGSRFWMPQIVQGMGFSNLVTSLIVAAPFVVAMAVMFAWGKSSDVRGERVWHVSIPLLLTGGGFVVASMTSSNIVALLALSVSMIGPLMFLGPFWGMNSSFLGGKAAAGAIALVSSLGSLGGFVGPYVVGVSTEATGTYIPGILALALALGVSATAVFMLGRAIKPRGAEPARQSA
jgi:ACS family tartrate transporter-like MFS transporter